MTDVVVSPEWLDGREDVRIVDVREVWEFEGIGHVPGAVNVPFDSFRAPDGDEGMLPGEETFAALLGEAGIERDDAIVAYDDTHGVFAARFLVTAELYGHDRSKLHLLDGDYSAWGRAHGTTTEPTTVERVEYALERPDETMLVDREAIEAAIEADTLLVDTRETWEYEEGHIPGAVQLDCGRSSTTRRGGSRTGRRSRRSSNRTASPAIGGCSSTVTPPAGSAIHISCCATSGSTTSASTRGA